MCTKGEFDNFIKNWNKVLSLDPKNDTVIIAVLHNNSKYNCSIIFLTCIYYPSPS